MLLKRRAALWNSSTITLGNQIQTTNSVQRQMESSTTINGVVNYRWCPDSIISNKFTVGNGHAVLVLNREIRIPSQVVQNIWENAFLRCTVDGGTNRWREFLNTHCQGQHIKPPDLITGDFDSITDETIKYFSDPSTRRVHTPDQNATDFTKAIGVVLPLIKEKQLNDIIALNDNSGRLDQIMANINTLFKVQNAELQVYLLSGSSMTWLLHPGKHSITIPKDLVDKQRWCALMPIGGRVANVTTTGLKWDLTNDAMEFGGMVSTSNTYSTQNLHIETDGCLVWSMGLFEPIDE